MTEQQEIQDAWEQIRRMLGCHSLLEAARADEPDSHSIEHALRLAQGIEQHAFQMRTAIEAQKIRMQHENKDE